MTGLGENMRGAEYNVSEREAILKELGFKEFFSDYAAIENYVSATRYSSGEDLIKSGSETGFLFYISSGRALVSPIQKYHAASHVILEAPCFTGEVSLFRGERTGSRVIALSECLVIRIAINPESIEVLFSDTRFLLEMCKRFAHKVVAETEQAIIYQSYDLTQKVARYFLDTRLANNEVNINKTLYAKTWGASKRHIQEIVRKFVVANIIEEVSDAGMKFSNKPMTYIVVNPEILFEIVRGKKQIGELI